MKRQPWVQPQGSVRIDEGSPLANGLIWAMVGDHAIGAGALPRPVLGSTDAYYGAGNGHQGKYLGNSGTTGSRPFTFRSRNVIARMGATDRWTLYVIRRTTDTSDSNDAGIIGVSFLDGVWGPNWGIADLRKNAGNDGFRFTNAYGSGSAWLSSTVGDPPWFDSEWHTIALTREGAEYSIYKNGDLRDTVTGTAGAQAALSASDDDVYILSYNYSASQSQCGEIAFAAIWDRTLSEGEIRALEQDPYQVLRPVVRMPTFKSAGSGAYTLTAAVGAFTLTGIDAGLTRDLTFAAETGAFTLTGITANLNLALRMTAETGAFTVTGIDAGLTRALQMTAETGALTLTGIDATLSRSLILTADVGAYTLTGPDGGLLRDVVLTADVGAYTLDGIDAGLITSGTYLLQAETGTFGITGSAAGLARESDDYSRMQLFMKMWRDTRP